MGVAMTRAAGIDLGIGVIKIVVFDVVDGETTWLGKHASRIRRRDLLLLVREGFETLLDELGIMEDSIDYVVIIGDGENILFCIGHFYSMMTYARGAIYLVSGVQAVVDIGALYGRVISIDERGKVLIYRMIS